MMLYRMIGDKNESITDIVLGFTNGIPHIEYADYCMSIDNYFNYQFVWNGLHEPGISVMGTSRAQKVWPP